MLRPPTINGKLKVGHAKRRTVPHHDTSNRTNALLTPLITAAALLVSLAHRKPGFYIDTPCPFVYLTLTVVGLCGVYGG